MKKVSLKEDIFHTTLTIMYDCTIEDARKVIYDLTEIEVRVDKSYEGEGLCVVSGGNGYIWLKVFKNSVEDICLLTHELLHFTFQALNGIGLNPTNDSDETYTYFTQYYQQSALEELLGGSGEDK